MPRLLIAIYGALLLPILVLLHSLHSGVTGRSIIQYKVIQARSDAVTTSLCNFGIKDIGVRSFAPELCIDRIDLLQLGLFEDMVTEVIGVRT